MPKSEQKTSRDYEIAWLDDHGPYEVCMMRFSLTRMKSPISQLDFNANFECFCVKARNLVDFFTGRDHDNRNFDAKDFYDGYKPPKREKLQGIINDIDGHVIHMSAKRPSDSQFKIQRDDCIELAKWIEQALALFFNGMPNENRQYWNENRANCVQKTIIKVGLVSASSADPVIISGPTGPAGP